jgi:hypothetical protein
MQYQYDVLSQQSAVLHSPFSHINVSLSVLFVYVSGQIKVIQSETEQHEEKKVKY